MSNPPPSPAAPVLAGRELDIAVAEKVMGWRCTLTDEELRKGFFPTWRDPAGKYHDRIHMPAYSTDWGAMGLVVERMRALDYLLEMADYSTEWGAWFEGPEGVRAEDWIRADTAPLAVALAALAALGGADGH